MEVVFGVLENMQQNAVQFLPFIDLERVDLDWIHLTFY